MDETLNIFKALSDNTRLKIILLLLDDEACVCNISPYIHRTQSTTSTHLKKLENWGILSSRRKGKYIFYKIQNKKISGILKSAGIKGDYLCKKRKKTC